MATSSDSKDARDGADARLSNPEVAAGASYDAQDITVLEIDFLNPDSAADHCPPRSTFVHRLSSGRSRRLDIHYV